MEYTTGSRGRRIMASNPKPVAMAHPPRRPYDGALIWLCRIALWALIIALVVATWGNAWGNAWFEYHAYSWLP